MVMPHDWSDTPVNNMYMNVNKHAIAINNKQYQAVKFH